MDLMSLSTRDPEACDAADSYGHGEGALSMPAPYVVLPLNPENREYLVFGLSWAVVIGHSPERSP